MINKKFFKGILTVAIIGSVAGFATPTPDSMRAALAVQLNSRLASSVTLTKDANSNIISFHVNGVSPSDAEILLTRDPSPLSTEFTTIVGVTKEGATCSYMLPTQVATANVVEQISKDLVNAGATNIQISKQLTGRLIANIDY